MYQLIIYVKGDIELKYGAIKPVDIADGPGVRVSLFVSGCRNHCKGCFQPQTWDFDYGKEFTIETLGELLDALNHPYIKGLTILGGDPFEPENLPTVCKICQDVKSAYPNKTIWVYTGYHYEDFKQHEIMNHIDVLVDGQFVEELKNLSISYRGSTNQRIIDVKTGENICNQWDHYSL